MLGREFSLFARVSLLQRGHQCISENGIRCFVRTVSLVGIPSFFKHDSFLSPGPPGYSKWTGFAHRTTLQNVPNIAKRILMSDPCLKSCRCLRTNWTHFGAITECRAIFEAIYFSGSTARQSSCVFKERVRYIIR